MSRVAESGSSEASSVRCPQCGSPVEVAADWRLVRCPRCGRAIARMEFEREYD
jgi:endogenous inhibitor of DNA gyrase (YacG/DUF329 family)